jgi:glycosyltransferase involved in cell wall biosynthesis
VTTASIVIPCYNHARFLGEAIESALGQTRPADEIVVLDDGSIDDSLEVARRYATTPTIRILSQPNQGAVAACNNVMRASSGAFFMRLDADDRLEPEYLEWTVPVLEAHPRAGYAYTGYRYFGSRNEIVEAEPYSARRLARRPYILGTTLIRRAAFEAVGGYSTAMSAAYEDWDLYLSLAEAGWYGVSVPKPLYQYRQHGPSRNSLNFTDWLRLMGLLYRRHPSMRGRALPLFLGAVISDRVVQRGLRRMASISRIVRNGRSI